MTVIYVLSRHGFDDVMRKAQIDDSCVEKVDAMFISILTSTAVPAGNFHEPVFKEPHPNVITLTFDDVMEDTTQSVGIDADGNPFIFKTGQCFTEDQADQLLDFFEANQDKYTAFIHCAAGISRSGAVGAFLSDIRNNSWELFKRINPKVHPNPHVLRTLKERYNYRQNENS